ncbi:MAG: serine hydrolase [Bacteroidetes bacterium]|nr:serine hydrolase [Bacteroidota bacterium]
MRHLCYIALFLMIFVAGRSQSLYFPPVSGTAWDTTAPSQLGWCQERIDSLYSYLGDHGTSGFIILKDGRIVLEKYFGTFTRDSIHVWASAGKSLTSTLTGIAQQEGLLHLSDTVSDILGQGWTSADTQQERQITIRHLISMTSGLDDNPTGVACSNISTTPACLQYLAPPGTRWAYHTGAYRKMEDVLATVSGQTFNSFSASRLGTRVGMHGLWVGYEYYSVVRDAARFGLLALNKGVWSTDTILRDTAYYHAMTTSSQAFNPSYGYLWWLNGQSSYMAPGLQLVYNGPLISSAPADMYAALGKNDQKIYVVPSQQMVVVRMGESAYGVAAAFSPFDSVLWDHINMLSCTNTGMNDMRQSDYTLKLSPNPATGRITVESELPISSLSVQNIMGETILTSEYSGEIDLSTLPPGVYMVTVATTRGRIVHRVVKE